MHVPNPEVPGEWICQSCNGSGGFKRPKLDYRWNNEDDEREGFTVVDATTWDCCETCRGSGLMTLGERGCLVPKIRPETHRSEEGEQP